MEKERKRGGENNTDGPSKNELIRKKGRGGGSHSAMTSAYKGRFKSNTITTRKDTDYRGENMVDVSGGCLEPQLLHYNGALRGMKATRQRKPEPFS